MLVICERILGTFFWPTGITELKKHFFPLDEIVWRKVKSIPTKTNKRFKFNYIPRATIEFQLTKLQPSKADGLDNLPPGLLKDSAKNKSPPYYAT